MGRNGCEARDVQWASGRRTRYGICIHKRGKLRPNPSKRGAGMRRQSRIRRGERGQSSVLAALLTIVLAMGMAMMVNVSKLVTEKIAMQNATDMAVYSGAATEAGYLNKMRAENQKLWQIISDARDVLTENGACDSYCPGTQLQMRTATF